MGIDILKKDISFFESNRANLLVDHRGKVALIKDQKLIGVFDSDLDAYNKGLELFGVSPFLFKWIVERELPKQVPALTLGILHARL